jgi:large subunit ribosomal protein L9
MKIILRKDHELLGDEGQIVEVKVGYARNYLIPNGYAVTASESNLKSYEEIKRQKSRKINQEKETAKKTASQLDNFSIEIPVKTGEDDKVYGSVTSQVIFDMLTEKGFTEIEKRKILLPEPIKTLGDHAVEIKLKHGITAKVNVKVISENSLVEELQATGSTETGEETKSEDTATSTSEASSNSEGSEEK